MPPPILVIVTVHNGLCAQFADGNVNECALSCIDGCSVDDCAVIVMVTVTAAGLPETVLPVSGSTALIVTFAE